MTLQVWTELCTCIGHTEPVTCVEFLHHILDSFIVRAAPRFNVNLGDFWLIWELWVLESAKVLLYKSIEATPMYYFHTNV